MQPMKNVRCGQASLIKVMGKRFLVNHNVSVTEVGELLIIRRIKWSLIALLL